ncbi:MAG: hypothetical protein NT064_07370 [Proteobacteria bacterium]|jgi:hypothetical protein|nr:hypothetical protein [Pseudomonadota bacterium]
MNILRYGHDAYDKIVINGISWDMLPVAVLAALAVIVIHQVRRASRKRGQ